MESWARRCAWMGLALGALLGILLARNVVIREGAVIALRARTTEVLAIAVALGALATGAGLARRRLRRARAYEDRTRYRPATIEADRVVLDADAAAYVLVDASVPPGRVLVREGPRRATDYRTTRTLVRGDIVRVDPATVLRVAHVYAADALRIAFCIAVGCTTVAGVEAAETWVRDRGLSALP